jgi:hypothetical protein
MGITIERSQTRLPKYLQLLRPSFGVQVRKQMSGGQIQGQVRLL